MSTTGIIKDISGKKFGKLTAVKYVSKNSHNQSLWEFKCDCGKLIVYRGSDVVSGHINTCGCSRVGCQNAKRHGMSGTKEQQTYYAMMNRCYNLNNKRYHNYGGRGVKVCERWLNSIDDFLLDVGLAPSPKHTLDRYPNKYGNYEPGNFRWATMKEQQNNRTNNHIIEYNGLSLTLAQWREKIGISKSTMWGRLKAGWPVERLLTR